MSRPVTFLLPGGGAERQLVEGLIRGEEASYRQLYESFAPRLHALLLRIFRDPNLVDDAVQATFLQVFCCITQFNGQSSLMTWITQIALNEAGRMARRQTRTRQLAQQQQGVSPLEDSHTPEQKNSEREEYACLATAIAALPLEKRIALLLFEIEGFSVQEIADIMGEPRGTVLARLSRTRAELRDSVQSFRNAVPASANDRQALATGGKRYGQR